MINDFKLIKSLFYSSIPFLEKENKMKESNIKGGLKYLFILFSYSKYVQFIFFYTIIF